MHTGPASLNALEDALRGLQGIGPKTAQRLALQLIGSDRALADKLRLAIEAALARVGHCQRCNTLAEAKLCEICSDESRNAHELCVVETAQDLRSMESTQSYKGYYFVMHGRLSPLDGIGPAELGFARLLQYAQDARLREVILATSFTSEGEATAHYLGEILRAKGLKVTRLARGLPLGSELENVDLGTIAHALLDRK